VSTVYVNNPTTDLQAANKAYVDSMAGSSSTMGFLMKKEFLGELVEDDGTLSAAGDLATLTASAGKDMYLASAKINVYIENDNTGENSVIVTLNINGTVKETFEVMTGAVIAATSPSGQTDYEFNLKGVKVAATEIIKLEVTAIDADVAVNGQLTCVEVDTGADPTA